MRHTARDWGARVLCAIALPFMVAAVMLLAPFAALGLRGRYSRRSNGHSLGCDCGECAQLLAEER
jgi:hypothetical protein